MRCRFKIRLCPRRPTVTPVEQNHEALLRAEISELRLEIDRLEDVNRTLADQLLRAWDTTLRGGGATRAQ